jgi:uncharacterized protein DUF3467
MDGEWEIEVPPDLVGGVYANFLSAWHTEHEFTLDFSTVVAADPPRAHVVSRIKVAPTIVFEMMRTINEKMTIYEQTYGEIRRPRAKEDDE